MKTLKIEIPKGYVIDEKNSTFENIVFKRINEYVDLGLPSGTLWAHINEEGYYSHREAIDTFGENNLPKLTDIVELYDYCTWTWCNESKSMIVTGPNGNYITFPASGFQCPGDDADDKAYSVNDIGYYWSTTTSCNKNAYLLSFYRNGFVRPSSYNISIYKYAIRKIKRK